MPLDNTTTVGIVGAGAMGTGIAQVAAAAGHRVIIADAFDGAAHKAQANIAKTMNREVEKGRLTRESADALLGRMHFHGESLGEDLSLYHDCGLVCFAASRRPWRRTRCSRRTPRRCRWRRLPRRVIHPNG
jgi:3-hydroxybutyryl-CoA dehydrogenase